MKSRCAAESMVIVMCLRAAASAASVRSAARSAVGYATSRSALVPAACSHSASASE